MGDCMCYIGKKWRGGRCGVEYLTTMGCTDRKLHGVCWPPSLHETVGLGSIVDGLKIMWRRVIERQLVLVLVPYIHVHTQRRQCIVFEQL